MKIAVILTAILAGIYLMTRTAEAEANISAKGLEAIKRREGLRLKMYFDSAGLPTIGYGHLIKPGENLTQITEQKAAQLLSQDIQIATLAINQLVKAQLNQDQFDALASFIFNIGVTAFRDSTLLKKLNNGDYEGAKNELQKWNKVTISGQKVVDIGLVNRRADEQKQFA